MDFLGVRTMEADHGIFRYQNNGGRPWTFKVPEQWGQTMDFLGTRTMEADCNVC